MFSLLSVIESTTNVDHYWSFDKADTMAMIKDEVTGTTSLATGNECI